MWNTLILRNNYIKIHCYNKFLLMMSLIIFYLIFKILNTNNTKFIFQQLYILKYIIK